MGLMNWDTLYTNQRIKESISQNNNSEDSRNSYQRDYDRIIFSAPFRRLQDKTQVFPLPGPVFVHNRLTHSLEVASVGRSIAKSVGEKLCDLHEFDTQTEQFYKNDLQWVIASACLAHDMGNPPFGHSGEDAIRTFFRELSPSLKSKLESELSAEQWADLKNFEGNSMVFRYLTQPKSTYYNSLNLTLTTIASVVKYPSQSHEGFVKGSQYIGQKKSGYFASETQYFNNIAQVFHLPKIDEYKTVYARHPFVFLTEAADDICYRIIDLEDAYRLRILDKQQLFDLVLPFFETTPKGKNIINTLHKIMITEEQIAFLRANWIAYMVESTTKAFLENESEILNGKLNQSLIDLLPKYDIELLTKINEFSVNKIYQYPNSIEIELGGYTMLGSVLENLINVILNRESPKSKKIIKLLKWEEYPVFIEPKDDVYNQLMFIVEFVVSTTDSYILDLFKKFNGISYRS